MEMHGPGLLQSRRMSFSESGLRFKRGYVVQSCWRVRLVKTFRQTRHSFSVPIFALQDVKFRFMDLDLGALQLDPFAGVRDCLEAPGIEGNAVTGMGADAREDISRLADINNFRAIIEEIDATD